MDTKERLRELVDGLDAEQAADAFRLLDGRYIPQQRTPASATSDAPAAEGLVLSSATAER